MKFGRDDLQLYVITDKTWLNGATLVQQMEKALKGGVTCIQYREKHNPSKQEAQVLKALCDSYSIPLIINNDVSLAIEVDATGVHLGQKDMSISEARMRLGKDKIIGASVRTVEAALKAEESGADYLGVGAVFHTNTKSDAVRIDQGTLKAICEAVRIPVIAIGGICEDNVMALSDTGIAGVAAISAVLSHDDITEHSKKLKEQLGEVIKSSTGGIVRTALTIAGSDCSGGAGIQADIKTMTMNGVYAMSVITALTAQNTTGVSGIFEVPSSFIEAQLESIFTDIRPDAVKIGMVSSGDIIKAIAKKLKMYHALNVVIDPVMVATSGSKLISDEAIEILKSELFPLANLLTPNIPEAEVLSGIQINSNEDMVTAAKIISETHGCPVLCKGGHLFETSAISDTSNEHAPSDEHTASSVQTASDVLYHKDSFTWFHGKRVNHANTHGTGCTLSSAIAANLAKGYVLEKAIQEAKKYIEGALNANLDLGKGSGPINHMYTIKGGSYE